jgi:uncharacterized protein
MGRHHWRSLLFAHWEIAPEVLRPLLPRGLEIDTFEGKSYVGLVPFSMPMVQPLAWLPLRVGFHETNVRTYVRHHGHEAGVWFFSLDAESSAAVLGARATFHLPYHRAEMHLEREPDRVRYRSTRRWPKPLPGDLALEATLGAPIPPPLQGSLAHFLVERYHLYAQRGDKLYQARVQHAPYRLREATITTLDESLLAAATLAPRGEATPTWFCEGVDVDVFAPKRVTVA